MAYPRNLLAPDENVVVDAHPHWKALLMPVIVAMLTVAGVIAAFVWTDGATMSDGSRTTIGVVVGAIAAIVLIVWVVSPYVRWATTHFVITDRRVIYRTGVFTKSGIDIPLARVNSVQFRHGFIDRMFRTGTLIIESASDDPLEFDDIPNVEKVHARLYHEVHDVLDGDEVPNNRPRRAEPTPHEDQPSAEEPPAV